MGKKNALRFEKLVDWLEGRLSPEEAQAIAAELETADDAVRADIAWLQAFYQLSEEIILKSPPSNLHRRLVQIFDTYKRPQRPNFIERLVATLTFDSSSQFATAGLRSAGVSGPERQLIYATEKADIALNIHLRAQDERVDLSGQVFSLNDDVAEPYSVQLLHNSRESAITTTNDLGEFSFEAVFPHLYEIAISGGQLEMMIPSFDLRP